SRNTEGLLPLSISTAVVAMPLTEPGGGTVPTGADSWLKRTRARVKGSSSPGRLGLSVLSSSMRSESSGAIWMPVRFMPVEVGVVMACSLHGPRRCGVPEGDLGAGAPDVASADRLGGRAVLVDVVAIGAGGDG